MRAKSVPLFGGLKSISRVNLETSSGSCWMMDSKNQIVAFAISARNPTQNATQTDRQTGSQIVRKEGNEPMNLKRTSSKKISFTGMVESRSSDKEWMPTFVDAMKGQPLSRYFFLAFVFDYRKINCSPLKLFK